MSNNFFLSQDPLLYQSVQTSLPYQNEGEMRKQLNDAIIQYRSLQQQTPVPSNVTDYLGDLDNLMKSLNDNSIEILNNDVEYQQLNAELQVLIQRELMSNIKWKINANQSAVKNIERQKEIINNVNKNIELEERRNLSELNDYVKNYSDMTFDDYKKLKAGNNINETSTKKRDKK